MNDQIGNQKFIRLVLLSFLSLAFVTPTLAGVTEAQKAKALEKALNSDIEEAIDAMRSDLDLKDIEVEQAKSVLNGKLKESLKAKIVAVSAIERRLLRQEEALKDATKEANEKVGQIEELRDDLTFGKWIQAALGSGFLFAGVTAFLQYRNQKRLDEKYLLEIRTLERKLESSTQATST